MAMTDTETEAELDATAVEAGSAPPQPALPPVWPRGTDHKYIGSLFVVAALVFLLVGAALAALMRAQLTSADATVMGAHTYAQIFTMHGTFSVFLFLLPVWLGLGSAIVPLQVGASRIAFPRVHAMSFWLFLIGGAMVAAAPAVSDVFSGWTLGSPIPDKLGFPGRGPDFLILGLALVCVAAVLVAVNLIVTVLQLRAPGLTLRRVPLFAWSMLVSSAVMILSLPVLVGAFVMLFVDRHYGASLFAGYTGGRGGNPLIWPRLFWFGAYPLLWALLIPALGTVCQIIPTFARRRLFSHDRAAAAIGGVGILSFAGWGSEVTTLHYARPMFILGALVVLAPVALLILNWLATLRVAGKETTDRSALRKGFGELPMLWALGVLPVLALGLAASVVSALDAGRSAHTNYWQAGQQHALYFGAATIGAVAALTFWAPKLWGRRLSAAMGRLEVLAVVGGTLLMVLGMLVLGAQDMALHLPTYASSDNWGPGNLAVSAGGAIMGLGLLLVVLDLLVSVALRRGAEGGPDPWGGHTLEWATPSPPPIHNFDALPEIRSATPLLDLRRAQYRSDPQAGPDPVPEGTA
ncbi:MAG: cbb3-type cytochrome c oxidase subunit I [Actinomycetota bacterium]|nr:cbb3-type cytochrome c oxidase subunit I [Actinomycetota bacterium]